VDTKLVSITRHPSARRLLYCPYPVTVLSLAHCEGKLLPTPFGVEECDRTWAEAPASDPPGTAALLHDGVHFAFG
jgi:hypothetical protein